MSYKDEITKEWKRINTLPKDQWQKDDYINSCLPMVVAMATEYSKKTKMDINELISEGNLGVCRAFQVYDPNRGAKFSSVAYFWTRAYILSYIQKECRKCDVLGLDDPIFDEDGETAQKTDIYDFADDKAEQRARKIENELFFENISERDLYILKLAFGAGVGKMTYTAIAEKFGLDGWKTAKNITLKVMAQIRANAEKYGLNYESFSL